MAVHVVQRTDTLWGISRKYGVELSELLAVNGLPSANEIVIGLALYIPRTLSPTRLYRIKSGDQYWQLAQIYNTTTEAIIEANPTIDPSSLTVGKIITIPTTKKMEVAPLGFIAPYAQQAFLPTLSALANQLTYLAVASYTFTSEGYAYVALEDHEIVNLSNQLGVIPLLMIRNLIHSEFSAELIGNVLGNSRYRTNLIMSIVNLVRQRGYRGVSIDFEFIPPDRRNQFLTFLADLKTELAGLILHVNVHAKTEDIPENPIIGAYDYSEIGKIADLVAVMTIDYGYPGGPPEPISPAWWVEQVLTFSIRQINPSKLQISLPLYGYDKRPPNNETNALSVLSAQNLAIAKGQTIQYDSRAESPFFRYRANDQAHTVWFEDIRSYRAKYQLIDLYQISGVTFWQLSQSAPQNWAFIRDNIQINKSSN